jgi:hypothetical protein
MSGVIVGLDEIYLHIEYQRILKEKTDNNE